jgi:hypothetical protein
MRISIAVSTAFGDPKMIGSLANSLFQVLHPSISMAPQGNLPRPSYKTLNVDTVARKSSHLGSKPPAFSAPTGTASTDESWAPTWRCIDEAARSTSCWQSCISDTLRGHQHAFGHRLDLVIWKIDLQDIPEASFSTGKQLTS